MLAATVIVPHPAMLFPFAAMLWAIALMPFIHRPWWERNFPFASRSLITPCPYVPPSYSLSSVVHVARRERRDSSPVDRSPRW